MKTKISEYKGFPIMFDDEAVTCKIIGVVNNEITGEWLNENVPYHSYTIDHNGLQACNYNPKGVTDFLYFHKEVDKHLAQRTEYAKKLLEVRKDSTKMVIKAPNVIITALRYGHSGGVAIGSNQVLVNGMPLRYSGLPKDFTVEDVLLQVYTHTVARHNISYYKNLKTDFYHKVVEKELDFGILPAFEYIGRACEYNGKQFVPTDIRNDYGKGVKFILPRAEDISIPTMEIHKVKVGGELKEPSMVLLQAMMNKTKYYE